MASKIIPWKENKVGEVVKGVMHVPNTVDSQYDKGGCLIARKNDGYGEILKVKIEGDKQLSSILMWA